MSIEKQIKQEINKMRKQLDENKDFLELETFYHDMQRLGIARSAKYDLPPVDTLGKRFYEIQHSLKDGQNSVPATEGQIDLICT